MRKIIIGIGVILAIIGIAIFTVTALVPSSVYKSTIEQQVSAKLGRNVQIGGDVNLSLFPTVRANAKDVTIANDEGFSDIPFIKMESLQAKIKLLPLLKKQVEITEFTLISPEISLEKLKNGQVNWNFGDSPPQPSKAPSSAFKRDGRYADLQISLGVFTLKDGQITYKDAQKGVTHTVKSANIKLAMLGMDKPVTAKGNLVFNDIPLDIDSRLETPKSFLNGQKAPFTLKLKSDLVTLSADGEFTPSKDIAFDIRFDTDIPSTSKLDKMLSISNPYGALSEQAKLKASLVFDGTNMQAKNAVLSLESSILTTNFTGDFTAGPKPTASGNLSVNISNPHKLQDTLGFNYPQLAMLDSVQLSTILTTDGVVTKGENVDFALKGHDIDASFKGQATFNNALSLDGNFTAASPSLKALTAKLGLKDIQGAEAIGKFSVSGRVSGIVDALTLSSVDFKSQSQHLNATYLGDIKLSKQAVLDGTFTAQSPSVTDIFATVGAEISPYINSVGDMNVSGQITGPVNALNLTTLDFKTKGNYLTAGYSGDVKMGEAVVLNGRFDTFIPSIKTFITQTGLKNPYSDALGALQAKGEISGNPEAFSISNIDANLSDGLLNFKFKGNAQTGKSLNYDGSLDTNITSLRKLLALGGIQLPQSTNQGEVYGPFSLSGQASGNAKNISFTNAKLNIDEIKGTGSFSADLDASKPEITGVLDLNALDFRPYMAAQNPSGKIQPWKEQPLDLKVLKLFDANFVLNTPNILINRLQLGQSNIKAIVKNGILTTDIPNINLYGGTGDLDMTVNGNSPVTKVSLNFTLKDVEGKGFLGAAAGFTKLTGNTGTTMSFRGSGRSQAEIMRSLNGQGNFELAEGVVTGVDIAQFVGGLDSALQSRSLPAGLGSQYTTPFDKIAGLFTVNNGVLTVGDFNLNSTSVIADGSGRVDIGQQSVDFSLQPRLKEAQGLAGFGIPIRFTGKFGNIKAGLDTAMLGDLVAAQAKAKLQSEINNRVGGGLGGVLGGVLGGSQPTPNTQTTPKPQTTQTPDEMLGGILGGILGTPPPVPQEQGKPEEPKAEPKKEEPKKEDEKPVDPLEKAFKDLFGGD